MDLISLLSISIALSMDAFSVSVCKGIAAKQFSFKTAFSCGLWFGLFQAMMPLTGYFLGAQFEHFITRIDHWIAFGLLALVGGNMIKEAFDEPTNRQEEKGLRQTQQSESNFKTMLMLAIATSIDAFAVGITFSFLRVNIWESVIIIGITTFVFSFFGVKIGNVFGSRYSRIAEIVGGSILIILGLKILLEHLCA